MRYFQCNFILAVLSIGSLTGVSAFGQTEPPPTTPGPAPGSQDVRINSKGGAVANRSPGSWVSRGLGRAATTNADYLAANEVTQEPSDQLDLVTQLRVQSLQALFTNINLMLNVYLNTIRAQFGLPPVLPNLPDFGDGGIDLPGGGSITLPSGSALGDIVSQLN